MISQESSGSVQNDVNAEADLGDQGLRASSDEDKDNMTPAQSRRKAQNRAAYAFLVHLGLHSPINKQNVDNEHSGNAKNDMLKIWNSNFDQVKLSPRIFSQTTSA